MKQLTEEQQEVYNKIKNAKDLMNGLFEMLEKSFDSIFEIEWSVLKLEIQNEDIKKKQPRKRQPRKKQLCNRKEENEVVIPSSSDDE